VVGSPDPALPPVPVPLVPAPPLLPVPVPPVVVPVPVPVPEPPLVMLVPVLPPVAEDSTLVSRLVVPGVNVLSVSGVSSVPTSSRRHEAVPNKSAEEATIEMIGISLVFISLLIPCFVISNSHDRQCILQLRIPWRATICSQPNARSLALYLIRGFLSKSRCVSNASTFRLSPGISEVLATPRISSGGLGSPLRSL
jgi:hypothetical protein